MPDVEFYGEKFELEGEFSEFALMEFAEAAESGADQGTMQSMAAMLRLVLDCIAPGDQLRFRDTARKNRAKAEKLMAVLQEAMTAATERPTGQPSDSSDGEVVTVEKSDQKLDAKVSELFPGRPELQIGMMAYAEATKAQQQAG